MFDHATGRKAEESFTTTESVQRPNELLVAEVPQVPRRSEMRQKSVDLQIKHETHTRTVGHGSVENVSISQTKVPDATRTASDLKDREILRLQRTLTEAKTANRARETQLRIAKEGLKNVRETLNETFAEYPSVREELKTVKQTLGRDHQAILYRKDIELFALRKMNEQREKSLTERDAKLEEMERQHKVALEAKDEQLRILKNRLSLLETQGVSRQLTDDCDGDHALEVRLLKVKKGRKSLEIEDERDALIAQLQEHLVAARKSAEAVVNQQAELQRAWDITKKIQTALQEEREQHTRTREQLQGVMVKLSDNGSQGYSPTNSAGRLPTIEEDEHDRSELEAMYDSVQKDNAQLEARIVMLEKRLQEANSRLFSAAQEAEALRDQIRFEQNSKAEIEKARSSVIHHVHLQRMEEQLSESQELLEARDEEIKRHKKSIVDIDRYVGRLRREIDAAIGFHTEDQEEIERLRETISGMQSAEEPLTTDHKQRIPYTPGMHVGAEQSSSGQSLSKHQLRKGSMSKTESNLSNLMSANQPLSEPREEKKARRTSSGLREMMRKMVRKDEEDPASTAADICKDGKVKDGDRSKMKATLAAMTPASNARASTAATPTIMERAASNARQAIAATNPVPDKVQYPKSRRSSMRHYTGRAAEADDRPHTAASKDAKQLKRRSWGANVPAKLNRRSLH